jgi:glycine/D-amino acid oxidase-like deaminating enzyme/nitrite reductase/ring-hydroxylating ferredoxin subunit
MRRNAMPVELDTTPLWLEASLPPFGRLDRNLDVDVLIVGGGITGLTAAYLLTLAGKRVALVERDQLARVDSGHTTAHLTMVTDSPMSDLVDRFGRDHATAVWDAGLAAIVQIDQARRRERIDCDFAWVPGYLHGGSGRDAPRGDDFFRREAALAEELGFDASFVDDVPIAGGPGVQFAGQARFHPVKYFAGLATAIVRHGGQIFERSAAEEFSADRRVRVNGHTVRYGDVVLATHTPLQGNDGTVSALLFQTKIALYTSYVVAAEVAKGRAPDVLLWDTDDPYRYYRIEPHAGRDLVIYGGEDHKTGQADDPAARFRPLERAVSALFPGAAIARRWSGQVVETPDGLPYIGRSADHQFVATGYSGNGMTFGTLGGMMAADFVLGLRNPWRDLFSPDRTVIRGMWDYIKENVDYPYYLVRDRFAGAESRTLRGIPRGEGRVVELNGRKVAAFRSEEGELCACSAVCTHLSCIVDWNDAEKTWDCPCHGSRFSPDGAVISGPAEAPLEAMKR